MNDLMRTILGSETDFAGSHSQSTGTSLIASKWGQWSSVLLGLLEGATWKGLGAEVLLHLSACSTPRVLKRLGHGLARRGNTSFHALCHAPVVFAR